MTIATLIGIFLIPVCYVFVQGLAEWGRKKPTDAATPSPELAAHRSTIGTYVTERTTRSGLGAPVVAVGRELEDAQGY
jgi:hypothetical protein